MSVGASAPGKLLIAGEYSVLEGGPAIVTAVQLRATARWSDEFSDEVATPMAHERPRFPEGFEARSAAEREVGEVPGHLVLDVSALRSETAKLGVGSSSAAAAAAAAAVFAWSGADLLDEKVQERVLHCAMAGHAAVSPDGSGVDVAAAVLGGTLFFRKEPAEVERLAWPKDLSLCVVWTGKPASTRELVSMVHGFRARDASRYAELMQRLREDSTRFAELFRQGTTKGLVAHVPQLNEGLRALGEASGAPIVEERLAAISNIARGHGGEAKPSGAGGGDVAMALFSGSVPLQFAAACRAEGFEVLPVELGGAGVRAI